MLIWCILVLVLPVTEQNVISTAQGKIRGLVRDGYVAYGGIPYGTVRSRGRFKQAGIAPFWQNIREHHDSRCSASSEVEECLQLDVNVPIAASTTWPVLVWVKGSDGNYDPVQLVRKGIIVVVVHHRLGALGFLCYDSHIPGNAGAKDVVTALRWVRDNIVAFKGNPARVVVAGQGLGASIVEALTLSPMADELFHGVILQSGSVLAQWAFNYDAKDRAKSLAKLLTTKTDVDNILFNATTEELFIKSIELDVSYFPFALCVEEPLKNEERLLVQTPYDSFLAKKLMDIPVMIGYNSDEGYIFASILKEFRILNELAKDIGFLIPYELKFLNEIEKKRVERQIEDFYFKRNRTMPALLAYHSDVYFINHVYRSATHHAMHPSPVYFYRFSYNGEAGVQKEPGIHKSGAAHSDELAYLMSGRHLDGEDGAVQELMLQYWVNFVKYLTPTPRKPAEWEPLSLLNPRLLDIGAEPRMIDYPDLKATQFWNDIYDKYYYSRNKGTNNYFEF